MEQREIKLNIDELTMGQAEFLEEHTGMELTELIARIQSGAITVKMTVALLAMQVNPENPAAGLDEVRQMKIAEVEVS
jgi:hypothetical protein